VTERLHEVEKKETFYEESDEEKDVHPFGEKKGVDLVKGHTAYIHAGEKNGGEKNVTSWLRPAGESRNFHIV